MSQFSDWAEPRVLDALFNGVALTGPNTMYIALYTATLSDSGGGTEVTGGAYARAAVRKNGAASPTFDLAVVDGAGYLVDNTHTITFVTATANWGNVLAFGLWDHLTTGNLLMWGPLTATKTVNANDTFKFLAGALDLRCE